MNLPLFALAAPDPTGLAAGRYPVPAWVIWLAGAIVVLGAVIFLLFRLRAARRARGKLS